MTPIEKINQLLSRFEALNKKYSTIQTKLGTVYNKGKEIGFTNGKAEGLTEGIEQGKADERNAFWSQLQNNGNARNYIYLFCSNRFSDETYNPIYTIKTSGSTTGNYMFQDNTLITDTKVPIDVTSVSQLNFTFDGATALETIRELIVNENTTYSNTFRNTIALKNLTMGGTIGNTLTLSYSPLSKESIISVISHLSDNVVSKTVSFKKTAVNTAFGSATNEEWLTLVATKPNWTISLA